MCYITCSSKDFSSYVIAWSHNWKWIWWCVDGRWSDRKSVYPKFVILAMAGYLSAVVRAPITAIILITEMTGSFENLLSIAIVVFVSYIISGILKGEPVYKILLSKLLVKICCEKRVLSHNKTLIEFGVEMGSVADGKLIRELNCPNEGCLLIAINRVDEEIIPRGHVEINYGDYLVVCINEEGSEKIIDNLRSIIRGD